MVCPEGYYICTRKECVILLLLGGCSLDVNQVKLADSVSQVFYILTDFLSSCSNYY